MSANVHKLTCIMIAGRNKFLKKYYRKLQEMRFHRRESFSINADSRIANDFLMVEKVDIGEAEDSRQKVGTLNYLREPLLDDID